MQQAQFELDVLMVSERPLWPLDQGYRVHGANMAWSLAEAGLRVGVSTLHRAAGQPATLDELTLPWARANEDDVRDVARAWGGPLQRLRHRLADHQGLAPEHMAGLRTLVQRHRPAVVIALGPHGPMMLRGLDTHPARPARVWYAADDPVRFHLSCLRGETPGRWPTRTRRLAVDAAIAMAFAWRLDGVIGVSPHDTAGLARLTLARNAITVRNGVDLDHYHPAAAAHRGRPSIVFWGRLDFEPNIDALLWFARHVWPGLHWKEPAATFRILGKHAPACVRELSRVAGIDVVGEVADVRPFAHDASVVVLPMRLGGGIKNKLLEAAAMGRPIVASPHAIKGLELPRHRDRWPAAVARDASDWVRTVARLWSDPQRAARLGQQARVWAQRHHDWHAAAARLIAWLEGIRGQRFERDNAAEAAPTTRVRLAA
mgnify:CR=1 FL=1